MNTTVKHTASQVVRQNRLKKDFTEHVCQNRQVFQRMVVKKKKVWPLYRNLFTVNILTWANLSKKKKDIYLNIHFGSALMKSLVIDMVFWFDPILLSFGCQPRNMPSKDKFFFSFFWDVLYTKGMIWCIFIFQWIPVT